MLQSRFLFHMAADVGPALDLASGGRGRLIVPVTGGRFEGPELQGTILPLGADWLLADDQGGKLDVRLVLRTADGALISMAYQGRHGITPALRRRIAAGEEVDPERTISA